MEMGQYWRRNESLLSPSDKSGGLVLLNLDDGQYYALDEVGSRVWELCDGGHSLGDIVTALCSEFDAPEAEIAADVQELIQELVDEKLLVECPAPQPSSR